MPKVIKIVVSDKLFEEHISLDPKTPVTPQAEDAMLYLIRMVVGENFKDTEEIEINTNDITDEELVSAVGRSLLKILTVKYLTEHGKKN